MAHSLGHYGGTTIDAKTALLATARPGGILDR